MSQPIVTSEIITAALALYCLECATDKSNTITPATDPALGLPLRSQLAPLAVTVPGRA